MMKFKLVIYFFNKFELIIVINKDKIKKIYVALLVEKKLPVDFIGKNSIKKANNKNIEYFLIFFNSIL